MYITYLLTILHEKVNGADPFPYRTFSNTCLRKSEWGESKWICVNPCDTPWGHF